MERKAKEWKRGVESRREERERRGGEERVEQRGGGRVASWLLGGWMPLLITNRKSYISFRLVLKSVTLNDLERRIALTLRYFNEFAKYAFQLMTGSSSIELIDQKSASVTHIAVNNVCITKCVSAFSAFSAS